jgi:hypothetical protein
VLHGSETGQVAPSVHETQLPELQTMFGVVPHDIPSGAFVPVSAQVMLPVEQLYIPTWQALLGVQLPPAVQSMHMPPRQTRLGLAVVPQLVPFWTLPLSAQVIVPVEQDVIPVLHGFVGEHDMPTTQSVLHEPLLQTPLVPQAVPFGALPLATQVDVPVAHEVVPVRQGLAGWQLTPDVQALHVPLLQTAGAAVVPQLVPFATLPTSAQTDVPVVQEVVPVRQGLVGWQLAPAVHATHDPALHTLFVPQTVPFERFWVVSEQVIVGTQVIVPAWQGLAGAQAIPAVQEAHAPLLQTRFVPQLVPLATFPDSVQTGAPVSQVVIPVRQGLLATVQSAPAWQATQLAVALQTLSLPQLVPTATEVPLSLHTGAPDEQASPP